MSERIVFFTGGTALRGLSRTLAARSADAVHLITMFDAGGSTAALRKAFAMPAVGDIRNRMLAIADTEAVPQSVFDFMQHRLPSMGSTPAVTADDLRGELKALACGEHFLWADMPASFATPLREMFNDCVSRLPQNFDPFGASLGNMVICGGYLRHKRDFAPVLTFLSQLLHVRGHVVPIVEESLHLACEIENGQMIVGQQHFKALPCAVRRLFLTVHEPDRSSAVAQDATACRPKVSDAARHYIATADVICYPMGSFYSSVLSNLLPRGVAGAIAANPCPKIFIPNSGADPEVHGLSAAGQVGLRLATLKEGAPGAKERDFLNAVLVDSEHGHYLHLDRLAATLEGRGIVLRDCKMVMGDNPGRHDPEATLQALLTACAFCR